MRRLVSIGAPAVARFLLRPSSPSFRSLPAAFPPRPCLRRCAMRRRISAELSGPSWGAQESGERNGCVRVPVYAGWHARCQRCSSPPGRCPRPPPPPLHLHPPPPLRSQTPSWSHRRRWWQRPSCPSSSCPCSGTPPCRARSPRMPWAAAAGARGEEGPGLDRCRCKRTLARRAPLRRRCDISASSRMAVNWSPKSTGALPRRCAGANGSAEATRRRVSQVPGPRHAGGSCAHVAVRMDAW